MRAVVQLVRYVDGLESEDPEVVLKVLEGVVSELHSLSKEDRERFLAFVEAEADAADNSPAGGAYRAFLLGQFQPAHGLAGATRSSRKRVPQETRPERRSSVESR